MKTLFLLSSIILTLSACHSATLPISRGPVETKSGIVNGSPVTEANELSRSVVAIVFELAEGQALCTGTIVDTDTILTAAHCVEQNPNSMRIVFANDISKATAAKTRWGSKYAQSPSWDPSSQSGLGDLALIHFDGGLPPGYEVVPLADESLDLAENSNVVVMGYGVTDGDSQSGAGILREASTQVIGAVSATQIALDGSGGGVCFGDSGGPAFSSQDGTTVQWGIASSVTDHACNQASVHTDLVSYRAWITKIAEKLR